MWPERACAIAAGSAADTAHRADDGHHLRDCRRAGQMARSAGLGLRRIAGLARWREHVAALQYDGRLVVGLFKAWPPGVLQDGPDLICAHAPPSTQAALAALTRGRILARGWSVTPLAAPAMRRPSSGNSRAARPASGKTVASRHTGTRWLRSEVRP